MPIPPFSPVAHGQSGEQTSRGQERQSGQPMNVMLNRLASAIPGTSAQELSQLDPEDYTPQSIADRISTAVASGLNAARSRGVSEDRIAEMYQDAVEGTQRGFDQARTALDNLGLLNDDLGGLIDETERQTVSALQALDPNAPPSTTQDSDIVSGLGISQRYSRANSFSMQVTTRDGDRVTINFSQSRATEGSYSAVQSEQGRASSFSLSRTESSDFRFSVEGDLDEDEIDALRTLVQDVNDVADSFFNGNLQQALSNASDIDFDSSELASMQATMTRSVSLSRSYAQVQQSQPDNQVGGDRLHALLDSLAQIRQGAQASYPGQGNALAGGLFDNLVTNDSRWLDASTSQHSQYQQNLSRILHSVFDLDNTAVGELGNND